MSEKRITKTKFGNLFELFFLSHKICLNSCHDFQSSLPHTILWGDFFPFLSNMNETEYNSMDFLIQFNKKVWIGNNQTSTKTCEIEIGQKVFLFRVNAVAQVTA